MLLKNGVSSTTSPALQIAITGSSLIAQIQGRPETRGDRGGRNLIEIVMIQWNRDDLMPQKG